MPDPMLALAMMALFSGRLTRRTSRRLECSDARFQSEILYAGFGIGLRPAAEVRRAVQEGTLERVLPSFSFEPVPVWVVGPKSRLRLPRVVRVVELVTRVIAALA